MPCYFFLALAGIIAFPNLGRTVNNVFDQTASTVEGPS